MKAKSFVEVRCTPPPVIPMSSRPVVSATLSSKVILDEENHVVKKVTTFIEEKPSWARIDPITLSLDFLLSQGISVDNFLSLNRSQLYMCGSIDSKLDSLINSKS